MKKGQLISWVIFFALFVISTAYADYLEVRRSADIYIEPNRNSDVIEKTEPGTYLNLIEDLKTNGYYHVRAITLGQPGWIYKTYVRRYSGNIPKQVSETEIIDLLADATSVLTPEQRGYAARHLRLGKPQAVYERVRERYVLAQDARLKIPLWVQYELSREDLTGDVERSDDFRPDTSIPFGSRAELSDYRGSGFDRGHMAPAADMKRNKSTMSESFLLSNMSPQVGIGFNRDIWADLEAAVRGWVEQRGALTIIIGPVFAVKEGIVTYKVIGGNYVAVPTHFYKIIVDANNPKSIEALAFLIPNENLSGHQYSEFLVSIDEIETATGLDFLSVLPASIQNSVESQKPISIW
jgi:endonuclease G